jgi:hypothetical protein
MDDDKWWEIDGMIGKETEVLGESLPQCRFVHHKSHMTWPGLELWPLLWEADDWPPEVRHCPSSKLVQWRLQEDRAVMLLRNNGQQIN